MRCDIILSKERLCAGALGEELHLDRQELEDELNNELNIEDERSEPIFKVWVAFSQSVLVAVLIAPKPSMSITKRARTSSITAHL